MARLFGVILPDNKQINYALTLIYGIGFSRAHSILTKTHIDPVKKVSQLTEAELKQLSQTIDKDFKVEGELRELLTGNIKLLKEIGCYRGIRHIKNLPVRGQRTRSNARTKRGKRKTVGALKKEAWSKMEQGQAKEAKTAQ